MSSYCICSIKTLILLSQNFISLDVINLSADSFQRFDSEVDVARVVLLHSHVTADSPRHFILVEVQERVGIFLQLWLILFFRVLLIIAVEHDVIV